MLFSFLGYWFETVVLRVAQGEWMARGWWFTPEHFPVEGIAYIGLPLIPLYGGGGLVFVYLISRMKEWRWWQVFLSGMLIITTLELVASYVGQWLHGGHRFWMYFPPFAFWDGRLDILSSITWGLSSVVWVSMAMEPLERLYRKTVGCRWVSVVLWILVVAVLLALLHREFGLWAPAVQTTYY
ncbi:putative ABC transporter permease [Candidatus Saccharibacteria bacterium]|nr:putative ABC transporter permease [Candidatus Saccharibacteria bacterium]